MSTHTDLQQKDSHTKGCAWKMGGGDYGSGNCAACIQEGKDFWKAFSFKPLSVPLNVIRKARNGGFNFQR